METRTLGEKIAAAKREIRARSIDGVERRLHDTTVELRKGDAKTRIVGLGIVYNSLSENLGGFREQIAPGAAEGLLEDPDVWGLFNHDPNLVLGRVGAGTMTLEDVPDEGVRYIIDPPATSYANDLMVSIARGDVSRSSFAFRVARRGDEWTEDEETGGLVRTVHKFSGLYDFSPVTYAAYTATSTGLRDSAPIRERTDDEPTEAARPVGNDGNGADESENWRLAHVRRQMAALVASGEAPADR